MSEWIKWQGGANYDGPLQDHMWCEVLMIDGEIDQAFAGEFNWSSMDEPGQIVAYRLPELADEIELKRKANVSHVLR
jgi:hypothetical protein